MEMIWDARELCKLTIFKLYNIIIAKILGAYTEGISGVKNIHVSQYRCSLSSDKMKVVIGFCKD